MPEFRTLLPQNSTQLEYDLERVLALTYDIPIERIKYLWNPDEIQIEHLPWLAWALSVDIWQVEWSESIKRSVVKESLLIHKHKGTKWAIQRLLQIVGVPESEIINWYEKTPLGIPQTFDITLVSNPGLDPFVFNAVLYNKLRRIIDSTKPERSLYYFNVQTSVGNNNPSQPIFDNGEITGRLEGTSPYIANGSTTSTIIFGFAEPKIENKFNAANNEALEIVQVGFGDISSLRGTSPFISNAAKTNTVVKDEVRAQLEQNLYTIPNQVNFSNAAKTNTIIRGIAII